MFYNNQVTEVMFCLENHKNNKRNLKNTMKTEKTKIRVVLPGLPENKSSWPHINYDYQKRADEVTAALETALPDMEFSSVVYYSLEEAREGYEKNEQGKFDGFLVYISSIWSDIPNFYATTARPVVISNQLYSGCGDFLRVTEMINQGKLPVPYISSSDFKDTIDLVRLFEVRKKLCDSKILVFSDKPLEAQWGMTPDKKKAIDELFGLSVVITGSAELKGVYSDIDDDEARDIRDKWISEAEDMIEPDEQVIMKSARLYLAIKRLIAKHQADAITIDCLNMFENGLDAYPCLSFFELNNEGFTGVCEGDVNSTISQLFLRYLTDKPAYVSDPVIDEAAGQVIYAHCVATSVPENNGISCPYLIRSHAEDRSGASVQTLLPLGKTVTTMSFSSQCRSLAVYTAETVANLNDEKACRTKLAAKVDTDKLIRNYRISEFSWHQVTCYGDYRKDIKNFAKLCGLKIVEQDRD